MEESSFGQISTLFHNLPEGTWESHKKLQLGQLATGPRFELGMDAPGGKLE
jgi:hypothetical protein